MNAFGLARWSCWSARRIGFAVAVLLRSQLAGVVVGIVLYLGEALVADDPDRAHDSSAGSAVAGRQAASADRTQWFQYLPFTIGGQRAG